MKEIPLTVALSGGGHRASVFSLGVLLYLVDSGFNRNVDSIVSVSGGSITNAFVAQECDFRRVGIGEFDKIASRLLRTIVERGVVSPTWATVAYVLLLGTLATYLFLEAVFDWPTNLPWYGLLSGTVVLAALFMVRGIVVSQLFARRFFRPQSGFSRVDALVTEVNHTFCATDLGSGRPFYISSSAGGQLISSLGTVPVKGFKLHEAVRASAAFPGGLPPKRLSLRRYGLTWSDRIERIESAYISMFSRPAQAGPVARLIGALPWTFPRALFLSDGGVWNNLATDWLFTLGTELPHPRCALVVDASAPLASDPLHLLHVPGIAEVIGLARVMAVQYNNTVEPRVKALEALAGEALRRSGASIHAPDEEVNQKDGPPSILPIVMRITEGRGQLLQRYRKILRAAGMPVPESLLPNSKQLHRIDRAWRSFWETHRRERIPGQPGIRLMSSGVGTTLGRIDKDTAVWLVVHGYLNAMTSLHIYCGYPFGRLSGMERFRRLLTDTFSDDRPGYVREEGDFL